MDSKRGKLAKTVWGVDGKVIPEIVHRRDAEVAEGRGAKIVFLDM
jgi:hypothetical protein